MKDEEARLAYEDATHIYWALFMILVDRVELIIYAT